MHHDAPKAGKKLLLCSVFGAEYETGVLAKDDSYVDEVTSTWLCHRNIIHIHSATRYHVVQTDFFKPITQRDYAESRARRVRTVR
jgi:hypothetical protein